MHYCLFDTDLGACGVAWSERGLTRFQLPEADKRATERRLRLRAHGSRAKAPPPPIAEAIADVQRYMAGERVDFSAIALDLAGVAPFYVEIYAAARRVGWGETATYGELRPAGRRPRRGARGRPGDGAQSRRRHHPLPPHPRQRQQGRRLLRVRGNGLQAAAARRSKACASARAKAAGQLSLSEQW